MDLIETAFLVGTIACAGVVVWAICKAVLNYDAKRIRQGLMDRKIPSAAETNTMDCQGGQ